MAITWEVVCAKNLAVSVNDITCRNKAPVLRVDDNLLCKACGIVGLSTECLALNDTIEAELTCVL